MSAESYYTTMTGRSEVWCLALDKEEKVYALVARANPDASDRFLAMPTFLQVLQECIGFKQFNVDHCV